MITKNCVFVLGAGSSKVFGFPTGNELKEEVLQLLYEIDYHNKLFKQFVDGQIIDFRESLLRSAKSSVDAFLENHPEFVEIGKFVIAFKLIEREVSYKLFRERMPSKLLKSEKYRLNGDWMEYLFNLMDTVFEDFYKNNVQFITFNYDRSLEQFLFNSLKHFYGKSDQEVAIEMRKIRIIHVHGQLGSLSWQSNKKNLTRGYTTISETDKDFNRQIKIAAAGIKIVHEADPNSNEFIEARNILNKAQSIIFLGFGYSDENINKLKLVIDSKIKLFGTSLGLTNAEKKYKNYKYFGRKLHFSNLDCLNFLRNISRDIFN